MALKYSLNLTWSGTAKRWTVDAINFGEVAGEEDDATDIHDVNTAMKIVAKLIDVIDEPIVVTSIAVDPGPAVSKVTT